MHTHVMWQLSEGFGIKAAFQRVAEAKGEGRVYSLAAGLRANGLLRGWVERVGGEGVLGVYYERVCWGEGYYERDGLRANGLLREWVERVELVG